MFVCLFVYVNHNRIEWKKNLERKNWNFKMKVFFCLNFILVSWIFCSLENFPERKKFPDKFLSAGMFLFGQMIIHSFIQSVCLFDVIFWQKKTNQFLIWFSYQKKIDHHHIFRKFPISWNSLFRSIFPFRKFSHSENFFPFRILIKLFQFFFSCFYSAVT